MNVKSEFLKHVKGRKVLAVRISPDTDTWLEFDTGDDVPKFIDSLDFDANSWDSEFTGTIWFSDGSWSTVDMDYETGEWYWRFHIRPEIQPKSRHR